MHGDRHGFAAALATERFVIQLGDLTDHGPGSADVLSLMLARLAVGTGLFLLGNHELKLARALAGCRVRLPPASLETVAALDGSLRDQALGAIAVAPAWFRAGCSFFVHGAFHPGMLAGPPPPAPLKGRVPPLLARALYGQTTGRTQPEGYPERTRDWIHQIPDRLTVYCGHDCLSTDGRPVVMRNAAGGRAVFLDTGAGKGGHLSWIDI